MVLPEGGYSLTLRRGVAEALHAAGLALLKPDGAYTAAETAILPGVLPKDVNGFPTTFDNAVVLTSSPFVRTAGRASGFTPVQVRARLARGLDIDSYADAVRALLERRDGATFGDVRIARVDFLSGDTFTPDSNGRRAASLNFLFHGRRPLGVATVN